ncbi:Outer membrane protein IcsA autotransporter precursor [bacterium YEK0313]|nr:Outer membrane protein IcsA autotransporter precursor [bacterium YEK0313]
MRHIRARLTSSTALLGVMAALAPAGLLFPSAAFANCVTSSAATTCDTTAPNPYTSRVGTGQADNGRTVDVNAGATIATVNTNAISLGNNATITIGGTVRTTSSGGAGTAGTGNNTVEFRSNSTLTILPGGRIIADGSSGNSEAINPTGFGNTIINRGLIQATNSAAIWFEDQVTGARNTVDNYGTIERVGGGAVMGSGVGAGIVFYNRTGGRILGNLSFGGGNDDLIFEAGSTATGGINGGGGTNNLTLQGAAGSSDTLPGSITNFTTLTKEGEGRWTVSGSLSGFTIVTVKRGVLALTGNNAGYTGNLIIDPAGTLEARAQSLPTKAGGAATNINNVQNNGLLRFTQGDDGTYIGQITGTGSVVKLGGGVLTLAPVAAAGNTFSGGLSLNEGVVAVGADTALGAVTGSLTFNGGTLRLTSSFDIGAARAITLNAPGGTIDVQTGLTSTLSQAMTGAGAFTKAGAGTLILTAANAYAGGTTISGGALQLGNGGTTGSVVGDITNNGTLAFNRSDNVTFGNVISGSGAVNQIGPGTTTFTNANTYAGGTTISGGALALGNGGTSGSIVGNVVNNAALIFNRSDAVTFDGVISGTGSVRQFGTGTTTLTGSNSYAGATSVEAGTLIVNGNQSAATGLTTVQSGATIGGTGTIGGDVTVAGGGTLSPGNVGVVPGELAIRGSLTLQPTSELNYNFGRANVPGGPFNDLTTVAGNLNLSGRLNVDLTPGGSFDPGVYRIINYGGTLTDNTLTIASLPPSTPPGTFFVQTSVANQVNLVNTAGLTLNFWDGNGGPKNDGAVNGGSGVWQNAGALDNWTTSGGTPNAPWSPAAFAVFMAAPGTVTVDNGINSASPVTAVGMQFASDGYVVQGGTLTLVGAPDSIIKVGDGTAPGAGYTATIDAVLAGSTRVVKTDLGTLVLNADNIYTGGTAIFGGVLQISRDANLGAFAGGLAIDDGTLRTTASFTLSRATVLGSGGGTVETLAATTLTHDGVVSGAGALTKTGDGALVLAAINTYSGGTFIRAGVLQVASDANLGAVSGGVTIDGATLRTTASFATGRATRLEAGGGTIETAAGTTLTQAGVIAGPGALTKAGDGTLALANANTYAGGTTIAAGTLQLGIGGTSGSIVGDVANAGTLAFNRSDAFTFAGTISGTGTVRQIGSGTTTLTAAGAYSGPTIVEAGTLAPGSAGVFSTASAFSVLPAGTLALNGFDQRVAALSNAGLVSLGGAPGTTLTVTGDYAGAGGTLRLNTQLGGDASPTDRLVVEGGTSGATTLAVVNRGGIGAPTVEGIKVIDVAGASNGTFALAGDYMFMGAPTLIAGAYGYQLHKGGVSTPGDGDWYLRSTLLPTPPQPPEPPPPPKPIYQPGVPLYEAYAQVLSQLNGLPTLQQRVGNRTWSGGETTVSPAGEGWAAFDRQGLWGRIEGAHSRFSPAASTSGTGFTSNLWRAQIGLDGRLVEANAGSLIAGVTAHYGEISAQVASLFGNGWIRSQGYGFGGTLTWYGQSGFYVDAQAQATWFDSKLTSDTLSRVMNPGRNGGFGYALGLEAGRRFAIAPQLSLTPQVQLIYSSVRFDRFIDPFGAQVSLDRGESLRSRFGLAVDFEQSWRDASGSLSRSRVYGIANLTYEFLGGMRTDVSGAKLISAGERLMGGIGVGGTYSWGDSRYALYGEGTVDTSLNRFGDSYAIRGTVGLRYTW